MKISTSEHFSNPLTDILQFVPQLKKFYDTPPATLGFSCLLLNLRFLSPTKRNVLGFLCVRWFGIF